MGIDKPSLGKTGAGLILLAFFIAVGIAYCHDINNDPIEQTGEENVTN